MKGFAEIPGAGLGRALGTRAVWGLWPTVRRDLAERVPSGAAEGLVAALHFTLVPLALVAGVLVDVWAAREVFCVGSLLTALGLFAVAVGTTYRSCLRGVLLAGAGVGALYPASCVLMTAGLF